jgi:hypothetical protein
MPTQFGTPYETMPTKTSDYTVEPGDDVILVNAASGAVTITLYTPLGNYPNTGETTNVGNVRVVKTDSSPYPVTVATAAGSIVGQSVLRQQGESGEFLSDGVGTWYNFGNLQDSFQAQIALSAADILGMNATPVTLIPAPGAGKIIIVDRILLKMVRTSTQFASGGAVEYRYTNGSGAKVTADMSATLVTGAAGTAYASCAGVVTELTPVANAAVVITNASAAFTTGTGTGVVTINFRVITA